MTDPKRKFVGGAADELSLVDAGANLQVGVAKSADAAGSFETIVSKQKDPAPKEPIVQIDGEAVAKAKRVTPAREQRLREIASEFNEIVNELSSSGETPTDEPTTDSEGGEVEKSKDPPAEPAVDVAKQLASIDERIAKALEPLNVEKQFADSAAKLVEIVADVEKKLGERDAKIAELEKQLSERAAEVAKARETNDERIATVEKQIALLMNAAPAPKATAESTDLEKKEGSTSVFTGLFKSVLPQIKP